MSASPNIVLVHGAWADGSCWSSVARMGADTIEVGSGHCAMISHPQETYERILMAVNAAAVPA
jgi:NADPH-dependent ferric siderophore reductase